MSYMLVLCIPTLALSDPSTRINPPSLPDELKPDDKRATLLMAGTSSQSLADRLAGRLPSLLVGILHPVHEVRIIPRPFADVQLCHAAMRTAHLLPLCNIPLAVSLCLHFAQLLCFALRLSRYHSWKMPTIFHQHKFDQLLIWYAGRICQNLLLQFLKAYLSFLVRHLVLFI